MKTLSFSSIISITTLLAGIAPIFGEVPDKAHLEAVYNTWRQSMVRRDYEVWKDSTAFSRQRKVRNQIVSEKKPFPESVFKTEVMVPALSQLKQIGVRVKGNTATATYFGKIDFGVGGKPTNNAIVLHFIKEKSGWKYDTARFFNLSNMADVRNRLEKGDQKVLDEHEGFLPTGVVPPVAAQCPAPQYIAKVWADCPGRKVDVTINGISQHNFENTRMAEVVSGGVNGGDNTITYTISDLPNKEKDAPNILAIGVFVMPQIPGNKPGVAYYYAAREKDPGKGGSFTFKIDKAFLKTMQGAPDEKGKKPIPVLPGA